MRLAPTAILTPAFDKAKDAEYPMTIATLFSNTLTTCQYDKQVIYEYIHHKVGTLHNFRI